MTRVMINVQLVTSGRAVHMGVILKKFRPSTTTYFCTMIRQQQRRICSIYKLVNRNMR
jgi:hypothetical protein